MHNKYFPSTQHRSPAGAPHRVHVWLVTFIHLLQPRQLEVGSCCNTEYINLMDRNSDRFYDRK